MHFVQKFAGFQEEFLLGILHKLPFRIAFGFYIQLLTGIPPTTSSGNPPGELPGNLLSVSFRFSTSFFLSIPQDSINSPEVPSGSFPGVSNEFLSRLFSINLPGIYCGNRSKVPSGNIQGYLSSNPPEYPLGFLQKFSIGIFHVFFF